MENLGLIIAIVGSAIAIVGVMATLFLWNRGEANADRREGRAETSQLRRDLIDCIRSIELEMKDFNVKMTAMKQESHLEMKDFHNRLCEIQSKKSP